MTQSQPPPTYADAALDVLARAFDDYARTLFAAVARIDGGATLGICVAGDPALRLVLAARQPYRLRPVVRLYRLSSEPTTTTTTSTSSIDARAQPRARDQLASARACIDSALGLSSCCVMRLPPVMAGAGDDLRRVVRALNADRHSGYVCALMRHAWRARDDALRRALAQALALATSMNGEREEVEEDERDAPPASVALLEGDALLTRWRALVTAMDGDARRAAAVAVNRGGARRRHAKAVRRWVDRQRR